MQLCDLFEKRERSLYQLFLLLRKQAAPLSLREASQQLQLSRATLLRYLETFSEEQGAGSGLVFLLSGEEVALELDGRLSSQEISASFCRGSVRYQLLNYLFERQDVSIQTLSQEVLLSEATLNRHLSTLNRLLKEFGIGIRNGRLRGSELQVRYFYYQLWEATLSEQQLLLDRVFQEQGRYLSVFERVYHSSFNPRQARQLTLWLTICSKRMRLKDADFEAAYGLLAPYQNHKFYRRLREVFLTVSQQHASSFQEGDSLSVFAFLFSQEVVAAHQLEQLLGFGGPIMEATSWAVKQVKENLKRDFSLKEEELYHLNQTCSRQYFFKGYLTTGLEYRPPLDSCLADKAREIVSQIEQVVYGRKGGDHLTHHVQSLSQLLTYLTQIVPQPIRIGFASGHTAVLAQPVFQAVQQGVEAPCLIEFSLYEKGQVYDLVICQDYSLAAVPVYQLVGEPTPFDSAALNRLLEQLYQEKCLQVQPFTDRFSLSFDRR